MRGFARAQITAVLLLTSLLLAACTEESAPTPDPTTTAEPPATNTPLVIPTVYPTFTRPAAPQSTATPLPQPTPSPQSTIDFEQPVVEFRYQIPALALDRRLEANVSGQITVVDETVGVAAIRRNQGGILLELQQALPELELEEVPADCPTCVSFSYELPLNPDSDAGWLTDPTMLASVENYTSVLLGPHFPPATVLGLRRSATPYDVAHSLALTDAGLLWRWLATEPDVSEAVEAAGVAPGLLQSVAELSLEALDERYAVDCPGSPVETLYINPTGAGAAEEVEERLTIRIRCPAFSLPSTLLPLYLQLEALMEPVLEEQRLPRPPLQIPLATMIFYQRADGLQLALGLDGMATATDSQGTVYTETIAAGDVLEVSAQLEESGELRPGLEAYTAGESENLLLVRGAQGMTERAWEAGAPEALQPFLEPLDQLLEQLVGSSTEADDEIGPQQVTETPAAATPSMTTTPEP